MPASVRPAGGQVFNRYGRCIPSSASRRTRTNNHRDRVSSYRSSDRFNGRPKHQTTACSPPGRRFSQQPQQDTASGRASAVTGPAERRLGGLRRPRRRPRRGLAVRLDLFRRIGSCISVHLYENLHCGKSTRDFKETPSRNSATFQVCVRIQPLHESRH